MSALGLAGCATVEPPAPAVPMPPQPAPVIAVPVPVAPKASLDEARALVAQAETDVQRARSRRALWSVAWEALVGARASAAAGDAAGAIRFAKRASEFAQLGLEQLAYPAVKQHASRSPP